MTAGNYYPDLGGFADFFLQYRHEKLLEWPRIKLTTLDLGSQSGTYGLSSMWWWVWFKIFCGSAQVRSAKSGSGKFSPKNPNISFFHPWIKKISLGQVKKYLVQRCVDSFLTAGQKYVRVGAGLISTSMTTPFSNIGTVVWRGCVCVGMKECVETWWWPSQSRKEPFIDRTAAL